MTELRGERVVVRPVMAGDVVALLAYRNDTDVARYQGWPLPFTHEHAAEFVTHPGILGDAGWLQRGVCLRDGRLIGDLGVCTVDGQAEVGITLAPDVRGRGYAAEALRLVLDHLFGVLGLHRVFAEADPRNEAVLRLLTNVGFRHERTRIAAYRGRDGWSDSVDLALLRSEWEVPG